MPTLAILAAVAIDPDSGCSRASTQTASKSVEQDTNRAIELVVYTGNFAMVNEERNVDLAKGRVRIGLQEVSKKLDQGTVV